MTRQTRRLDFGVSPFYNHAALPAITSAPLTGEQLLPAWRRFCAWSRNARSLSCQLRKAKRGGVQMKTRKGPEWC